MSLVDSEVQSHISKEVAGLPHFLSLGGSADNTIRAMARLGTQVGFIGKVGRDNTGDRFEQALNNLGIEGKIFRNDSPSVQQQRNCDPGSGSCSGYPFR